MSVQTASIRDERLYLPPGAKVAHSAAQVSKLFSSQRSCHFHAQRPPRLYSKCTYAHLCAHGSVGLKRRFGQVHCWNCCYLVAPESVCTIDQQKTHLKSGAMLSVFT